MKPVSDDLLAAPKTEPKGSVILWRTSTNITSLAKRGYTHCAVSTSRSDRGEFVAVMGASGSGESTFMNILGCLDKPSSGRYLLEGTDVSSLTKRDLALIRNRRIGFVFQGFNLLARTTALENTELPTLYARVEKVERAKRSKDALTLVGLGDRIDRYPSQSPAVSNNVWPLRARW